MRPVPQIIVSGPFFRLIKIVNQKLYIYHLFKLLYTITYIIKLQIVEADSPGRKHDRSRKGPHRNSDIAPQSHKGGRDSRDCGFGEVDDA